MDRLTQLLDQFFKAGGASLILGKHDGAAILLRLEDVLVESKHSGPIVISCRDPQVQILAQLVCMQLEFPFVPVNADWPNARIEKVTQLSGATTVLHDGVGDSLCLTAVASPGKAPIDPDVLYVIFTSGSTGDPKGVVIQRPAYLNFLDWMGHVFSDVGPEHRLLGLAEFTFDLSHMNLALLLLKRAKYIVSDAQRNPLALLAELEAKRITTLVAVPTVLNLIVASNLLGRFDLGSLSHLIVGGSAFPVPLYHSISTLFPKARTFNFYGPTEATVFCTMRELVGAREAEIMMGVVSAGTPLPNCRVMACDPAKHSVRRPPGEVGEILIGGDQLLTRYVNPSITQDQYITYIDGERWYKSGDLGFVDKDGNLFILGRLDDTIKTSGYRVNTAEVEGVVRLLGYVQDAAVVAIPDALREHVLVAFVVCKLGKQVTPTDIRAHIAVNLTTYQLPVQIHLIERLPFNENGKVDKNALISQALALAVNHPPSG